MLKEGTSFYLARKRILSAFFIGVVAVFGLVGCNDAASDQRDNSEHISNSIIVPAKNGLVSATEKTMSISEDRVASQQASQQKGNEASSNALITKDIRTSLIMEQKVQNSRSILFCMILKEMEAPQG